MARVSGRGADFWMDQSAGGTGQATPVRYLSKWSLNGTTQNQEVTAFGDTSRVYIQNLPDAQGAVSGFYDSAATTGSQALFTISQGGVARKAYMYPTTPSASGPYFFGTIFFSTSYDVDVSGPVAISGTWAAATSINAVG